MKIQKVTNETDIENAGGGYVLTAENDTDNAVVNVLIEMMMTLAQSGDVSDDLANAMGCHHRGGGKDRNFVYLPDDDFALRSLDLETEETAV